MKKLIFAIPKGRIGKEVNSLLEKSGIVAEADFFDESSRKLQFTTSDESLDVIRVRAFDVATLVATGAADIGVCGYDVLHEFDYNQIIAPLDLKIGACRMSVAGKNAGDIFKNPQIKIATKYTNTAKKFFGKSGVQAECIKLNGAVELAVKLGVADYIVDLVSTGTTLKENNLTEVTKIFDVTSRLILNQNSYLVNREKLDSITQKFYEATKNA